MFAHGRGHGRRSLAPACSCSYSPTGSSHFHPSSPVGSVVHGRGRGRRGHDEDDGCGRGRRRERESGLPPPVTFLKFIFLF